MALPDSIPVRNVYSVNDEAAQTAIADARPDLILVYGTGLVKPETYRLARLDAINAHGGKLPGYRGLDTNLWATLEGHPENMTATLHRIDEELDTGPVYLARPIGAPEDLALHTLRYHTAVICTDMFIELVRIFMKAPPEPRNQDLSQSRYYGPMPWILKRRVDRMLRDLARRTHQAGSPHV